VPSAYTMCASFVARLQVSRLTFCSRPPPMPNATACKEGGQRR
jgi:hypothetical protein